MNLNIPNSCGNSPKSDLIKKLTILFASYDLEEISEYLSDNISWTLVGDDSVIGKKAFISALQEMSSNKAVELTIHSLVTHGKEAAVHGEMLMESGTRFGFADFYTFTSAKGTAVKSIVTYIIQK